ncbi:neo-calmodulin-like [Saccoglossus kowalevskii]|uniref:Calmodulin-like n=1 Tax=Saccoglossus kowalevskii TaxID=10224 RepID=A0ABM0MUC9_SACKO|nr:PREDICTED: calmodulin-like [Saccoglossus kowalevskii]
MGCGGSKKTSGSEPAANTTQKQDDKSAKKCKKPVNSEEKVMEAFKEIDKDDSGYVTVDEVKKVLKDLGEEVSDEDIDKFFESADKNDDGKISYNEFYAAWVKATEEAKKEGELSQDEMLEAFKALDADGNGSLTKDEVKKALQDASSYYSDEQVDSMIKEADEDKDGKVDYKEFVKVLKKESQE